MRSKPENKQLCAPAEEPDADQEPDEEPTGEQTAAIREQQINEYRRKRLTKA